MCSMEPVGGGLFLASAAKSRAKSSTTNFYRRTTLSPTPMYAGTSPRSLGCRQSQTYQDESRAALHQDGGKAGQRTYAISLTSAASDRCPTRGRGSERRRRCEHGQRYEGDRSVDSLHVSSSERGRDSYGGRRQRGCVLAAAASQLQKKNGVPEALRVFQQRFLEVTCAPRGGFESG